MVLSVHSSELMDPCPRRAKLRIEGKEHGNAEGALVGGLLLHEAVQSVLIEPELTTCSAVELAWDVVTAKLLSEGRAMTAAVVAGEESTKEDVAAEVDRYRSMVVPMIDEVVGCELPVSIEIDVDGEPVRFESHIDAVWVGSDPHTGERAVVIEDYKRRKDEPSSPFLARNLQLGMYQYAVANGGMQVGGWPWIAPEMPIRCYWTHIPNFKVYKRRTPRVIDGETVVFEKGQSRAIDRIMFDATVTDWDKLLAGFAERVRMMRADIWPAIPEPDRCKLCQSNYACPAWGAYA